MKLPLWRIAEFAAKGEFDQQFTALGYSIDARALNPGDLFIALTGDGFDCPDDIEAALRRREVAFLGRGGPKNPSSSGSCAFRGRYAARGWPGLAECDAAFKPGSRRLQSRRVAGRLLSRVRVMRSCGRLPAPVRL